MGVENQKRSLLDLSTDLFVVVLLGLGDITIVVGLLKQGKIALTHPGVTLVVLY